MRWSCMTHIQGGQVGKEKHVASSHVIASDVKNSRVDNKKVTNQHVAQ